jgi:hypothetical protein
LPLCGKYVAGNTGHLLHGTRRLRWTPQDIARRKELSEAILLDLGGSMSAVQRELVTDFANTCIFRDHLSEYLEQVGPLTERGNRRAVLDSYLAASARVERLASQIRGQQSAPAPERTPTFLPAVDSMPTSALDLRDLLKRVVAGETLSDGELAVLAYLRKASQGKVTLQPDARRSRQRRRVARLLSGAVVVSAVSFTSTAGQPDEVSAPYTHRCSILNCRPHLGVLHFAPLRHLAVARRPRISERADLGASSPSVGSERTRSNESLDTRFMCLRGRVRP